MNDAFRNIYTRRSIREYKPDVVPDDIIKELIKAATYAPSARHEQPWRFVVIKNKDTISRLSERSKKLWLDVAKNSADPNVAKLAEAMKMPGFNIFYNAPVLVLIFAAPGAMFPECDIGLAAENMMLAANSLGIGSCWIGLGAPLGADEAVLDELKVPKDHRLIAPLIFGYPVKDLQPAPPRKGDVTINWIN